MSGGVSGVDLEGRTELHRIALGYRGYPQTNGILRQSCALKRGPTFRICYTVVSGRSRMTLIR